MNSKKLRNTVFILHRYLGLVLGLVLIIVGLTGSLLVFQHEISDFILHQQIEKITPQGRSLPIATILERVQTHYAQQPDITARRVYLPATSDEPINIYLKSKTDEWAIVYVNPYTGAVLGDSLSGQDIWQQFLMKVYELHYALLAGDFGIKLVGVVGLLTCILIITGIFLWSGWRKLIAGFKIKWNAHPKRVSFDIHKVAGIVTAIFLFLTFFTGFCWNLGEIARPIIYAVTFSSMPADDAKSSPVANKSPLPFSDRFLEVADAALPEFRTIYVALPADSDEPNGAFIIRKSSSPHSNIWDSSVFIDAYNGKILRVDNGLTASLGTKLENAFGSLHYGTFWGLPSRILYVFVGLAPLILFITGFTMYRYRYRAKSDRTTKIRDFTTTGK